METDKNTSERSLTPEQEASIKDAIIRQQQQDSLGRVAMSGSSPYFTQYDKVIGFHALALEKGISLIGNVTENPPAEVLVGRRAVIVEEVNAELIPLLDKMIENGGAVSLEQRTEMLDHIVDSVYVLMGLAANLGLPFDIGFEIVNQANMQKCVMPGAPIYREDGKLLKPEGWEQKHNPHKKLFEAMMQLVKLEHRVRKPQVANNLPDPKGTNDAAVNEGGPVAGTTGSAAVPQSSLVIGPAGKLD